MTLALNDASLAAAKPGDILIDALLPGLSFRVTATKKAFYITMRTSDGRQRRPERLGDCNILTLAQARAIATARLLAIAADTYTPSPTVAELADRYWEREGSTKKSARDIRRHLDAHIRPLLGSRRVGDIAYLDCERLHDRLATRAPIQANRLIALFSVLLSRAERWGYRPINSNPCSRVQRTRETSRRRHMSADEAPRIAAAMAAYAAAAPRSVAFLYLLILTGARRGEIAAARREWIEGNILRLPDSKTGPRDIYLPPQVLDLLATLPHDRETITGIIDPSKVWAKIRKKAKCKDLRIHDLRRSFASAALSAGLTLSAIGALLGHRNNQTTLRYAHLMTDAGSAAVTKVADRLTSMMLPKTPVGVTAAAAAYPP